MNFQILEMLYSIPELRDLSYQFYQQMPSRVEAEQNLKQVWNECTAASNSDTRRLFLRLEDAVNHTGSLQSRASFFAGAFLIWHLFRAMEQN